MVPLRASCAARVQPFTRADVQHVNADVWANMQCPLCAVAVYYVYVSDTDRRVQHGENPEHVIIFTDANVSLDVGRTIAWLESLHV